VEKASVKWRQVWAGKTNTSEPLMTRRYDLGGIETGEAMGLRDESGGFLSIGLAVLGVEVA